MKPIELHEKAMYFSFLAKQARESGNEDIALNHYQDAAELESQAAEYYLDKLDLEPTRSILIRSAAYLNLKAGLIETAEKFIFIGLINSADPLIKDQLYNALEICLAFKKINPSEVSSTVDYILRLRQKSILYTIEPKSSEFSTAVSLDMISDFSDAYTKSLRAYSKNVYKDYYNSTHIDSEVSDDLLDEFQKSVQPLVTSASFGSFKFAVASDFQQKFGENREVATIKSNIILKYHEDVFIQDLTPAHIENYKKKYSNSEIDEIFRPIINIKTAKSAYKIGYYDRETLERKYIRNVLNTEKKNLLPIKEISGSDIGMLETIIAHTRGTSKGSSRHVIMKQQLKSSSFDYPIDIIAPKNHQGLILTEKILVNVDFNSEIGFTLVYEDLNIEFSSIHFEEALNGFHELFRNKILELRSLDNDHEIRRKYWPTILGLIANPDAIT